MKKIIAKTIKGKEFFYSRINCYSVSPKKAGIVCKALNDYKYNLLNDNEKWNIYDISEHEIKYTNAIFQKLICCKGKIKIQNYCSVYPGGKW